MSNNLKNETSPYLLQHAENPVNWYPWCDKAFELAKIENKPVFLSIGYSTCHWCHVMARESFCDEKTAGFLNENFISVKVDREERPDIDSVYMTVCREFTGGGGWPMSVFMTWDKKPFFAGTYFPVRAQYGMPAFLEILDEIVYQWNHNRENLIKTAQKITDRLKKDFAVYSGTDGAELVQSAVSIFLRSFDKVYGGFGSAPKFPVPHNLMFLMLYAKIYDKKEVLKTVEKTLLQMRRGGIFDHIGYGFSRYSTDRYFLVPHFEKMLYDNALLIIAYSAAGNMTGNNIYIDTAEKTAEYILSEMTSADGGFYSAQDADSEGIEGKYYTFTFDEIIEVLGVEKGKVFSAAFDITQDGNFDGRNIPNLLKTEGDIGGFDFEIKKLYEYRKKRTSLYLDDKILTSWNSLMIAAMSILYRTSHKEIYLSAAKKAQSFIEKNLCEGFRICASFRDGKRSELGFLDDYAFYIAALIELYNSVLDRSFLEKAEKLCAETVRKFSDVKNGGFNFCETDGSRLLINPNEAYDGALPSGNSVMAYNFVRLYQITENEEYRKLAQRQIDYMSGRAQDYPAGYCMFLIAKLLYENPPEHISIVLKDKEDISEIRRKIPFMANISVVQESGSYLLLNGETTYYICKDRVCLPPVNKI